MFGINLSGAEFGGNTGQYGWNYIYPSTSSIQYYASKGVDLIRLPFKWERLQPTLGGDLDQAELTRIKVVLQTAQENGMKVVLDVHNFGEYFGAKLGSDVLPITAFQDLWAKIAGALKDYPAVDGYGLMNEPVGLASAQTWTDAAQAAINSIRGVDTHTPIYVMGYDWGAAQSWQSVNDGLKNLQDPSKNLVFEAHQYFDKYTRGTYQGTYDSEGAYPTVGVDRLQPFIAWLKENNLKGFIGEYSVPDNDPRWQVVLDNFLAELGKNGISSAYYGAGPWWGSYPMSIEPDGGIDSIQMDVLKKNITAYHDMLAVAEAAAKLQVEAVVLTHDMGGTIFNDVLVGVEAQHNIAHGGFGHDTMTGQSLADQFWGGVGNDTLWGNGGADSLYGEAGEDKLYGGSGNDLLDGGDGNDRVEGGDGDDNILGGGGIDMLYGDAGDDVMDGGTGNDIMYGGSGNDLMSGGDGNDRLEGGDSDDYMEGNAGNDNLYGQEGDDYLVGGDGADNLYGGIGNDRLEGGLMRDFLFGEDGDDTLYGGAGDDILDGGAGNDILYADDGADVLNGRTGDDMLHGGSGFNKIYGDEGNDILFISNGADKLYGGIGADTFVFNDSSVTDVSTIGDFSKAQGDRIDLSALLQGYDPLTKAITDFIQITTSGANSILKVDINGGGDHFVQIGLLAGVTGLTDEQALVNNGTLIVS
jgi:Ca2+-binding RTX toxin-like protein/aryl-phospho-beta-D-glucosidase BglC (GH1 family)